MTTHRLFSLRSTGMIAACVAFVCMAVVVAEVPAKAETTAAETTAIETMTQAPAADAMANEALSQDATAASEAAPENVAVEAGEQGLEEAHEESKGGFPQLDTSTYASQVFWLAISFALLYLLMSRLALPRMVEVFEGRESHIATNLDQAGQLNDAATAAKQKLDAALASAQEQAQALVSAAETSASARAAAETTRFAEQARERVAKAEQNIAKAKAEALASLSDIAAEVAADMVNSIAKTHLTKAEALPAVKANLEKVA